MAGHIFQFFQTRLPSERRKASRSKHNDDADDDEAGKINFKSRSTSQTKYEERWGKALSPGRRILESAEKSIKI